MQKSKGTKYSKVFFLQTLLAEFVSQITSGRISLDTEALKAGMKSEWVKLQVLPEKTDKTITYYTVLL